MLGNMAREAALHGVILLFSFSTKISKVRHVKAVKADYLDFSMATDIARRQQGCRTHPLSGGQDFQVLSRACARPMAPRHLRWACARRAAHRYALTPGSFSAPSCT